MLLERSLSVSELNDYVRKLLAGDLLLRNLEVSGEISGFKRHMPSGHLYFSLKDATARVECAMYRQNAVGLDFAPQDGMRVRVRASASLYTRDGKFQLYVSSMRKLGVGDLYQRFEELKAKLAREGLFDDAIKKPIPPMPKCLGIVTSRTGAAIRDMIRVARRRDPNVGFVVAPCAVQGAGAAREIAEAIERLNADGRPDVILCGRGGGSIEDLWAFNEEIVARAIAASRIPVISCVGHETDFTIADFVADQRAATPSMAAELAVPMIGELRKSLRAAMNRVGAGLRQGMRVRRSELARVAASSALRDPGSLIRTRRECVGRLWERATAAETGMLAKRRARLERLSAQIGALNPDGVLNRGYACVSSGGRLLSSAAEFEDGMPLRIRMRDGEVGARVTQAHMIKESDIEGEMYRRAVALIERRHPKGWGGAAVVRTAGGHYFTSVGIETANASAVLCVETGAILEAHKYNERVTHCLCLVRDDEKSPFKILTPCGICQERLRYWGEDVRVAVTTRDGALRFVPLGELQPYHWTGAYPPESLERFED